MAFPLITDPYFYLVTIPAVLLLGISKSGFGAGFGSLAVPMMALAVSVPQAAAILMPVLLLMDILGMAAFRKDFDRNLLKFLIPCGLAGILIGAALFKLLDAPTVAALVGVFTLFFLAQRLRQLEAQQKRWDEGAGYAERETFEAFLQLPAPQRKLIREIILTFAKVHPGADAPNPPTV